MAEVAYTSVVRVEQGCRPVRRAYLPTPPEPVIFGVHGAVADRRTARLPPTASASRRGPSGASGQSSQSVAEGRKSCVAARSACGVAERAASLTSEIRAGSVENGGRGG